MYAFHSCVDRSRPHPVGLYAVVALLAYFGARRASQYVGKNQYSNLLISAYDCAAGLLHQHAAVKARGRIKAYVAVAAIVVHHLAEIAHEHTAAAYTGLGKLLHPVEVSRL